MKYSIPFLLAVFFPLLMLAQKEYHVFPEDHKKSPGKSTGDGSLLNPWDLQTALNQKNDVVNGGDTIWLHEGVYTGRYISKIESNLTNKFIVVSAYKADNVVLNGNIQSSLGAVLDIKGARVIFKNFEITFLGNFNRNMKKANFKKVDGINHASGETCQFINLSIHDNPGSGIGSWKYTADTKIIGCYIYNNGYDDSDRGHGVGIYVQNISDKNRLIQDCVIFNNYYKGVEIWSATSGTKMEFVKNVILENNVLFNNGNPSGVFKDNVIVASNDNEGINVAKHIVLKDNVLYHNVDFHDKDNFGNGTSLSLGYIKKAPVQDITVENNSIIGKNNALNILYAKSLTFKNNLVYTGYVHFNKPILDYYTYWHFDNNTYFTRKSSGFRILDGSDYSLSGWNSKFNLDINSTWHQVKDFSNNNVLNLSRDIENPNKFRVVLLEKDGHQVRVDFSQYGLKKGASYSIYDVENIKKPISKGTLSNDSLIEFPMDSSEIAKPIGNSKCIKTPSNFGVFIIEFSQSAEEKKSFFEKLFGWMF